MLTYTAAALLATSVFAAHELPSGSGILLSYAQGGADWPDNCPNSASDQSQSPIDINNKMTIDHKMSLTWEGLEHWGFGYAPPTPLDNRAAAEPDYSWEMHLSTGVHDSEILDWTKSTHVTLDAPWPIGKMVTDRLLFNHFHTPSEHTFDGKHYDLEMHMANGDGLSYGNAVAITLYFDRQAGGDMDNPFITTVLDAWKTRDDGENRKPADYALLAKQIDYDSFYAYVGGLTSPDCVLGLTHAGMSKVLSLSQQQYEELSAHSPDNLNGTKGNNRMIQSRDFDSYPVFYRPSTKENKEMMMKLHHHVMESEHEMSHMNMGCGMMEMMMGEMCMSATYIMAYAAPLAAAIAVAAF